MKLSDSPDQVMTPTTGVVGGMMSLGSFVLANIEAVHRIVAVVGTTAGTLIALISLTEKLIKIWQRRREAKRPFVPPVDPTDDIPL